MSSSLRLNPGNVYFLRLQDPETGDHHPYVKIGITHGPVADRIRQLKTGSPYSIVEYTSFASEAAHHVEQMMHRRLQPRRRNLEWFRIEEAELPDIVAMAREYSDTVGERAERVRELNDTESDEVMLDPDERILELQEEVTTLLKDQLTLSKRLAIGKAGLALLTARSTGIEGVTKVTITDPEPSFSKAELKRNHPELHAQFKTRPAWSAKFAWLGKPRATSIPELQAEFNQAEAAVPGVAPDEVQLSERVPRSDEIVQIHGAWVELTAELAEVDTQLSLHQLELRDFCGSHKGINGVCTFVRGPKMEFDEEAFQLAHPDIYEESVTQGRPTRRFAVEKSRNYL